MEDNVKILITGSPGVGKTTLLETIKNFLIIQGALVGGVFCPEIKSEGKRVGFAIIDIMSGKKGILALKNFQGPRVGAYGVNIGDLNKIGVNALENAILSADYVMLDEIAPMELKSPEFARAIKKVFNSSKTVIAVIHKKSTHEIIQEIKNRNDVLLFEINRDNMDIIHNKILEMIN
jgi:nucleoside-triphosphatase